MSGTTGHRSYDESGIIVLRFIERCMRERGYPPSRQEIAEELELQSKGSTQPIMDRLVEQGLLRIPKTEQGQRAVVRAVTITEAGMKAITEELTA